MADVEYFHPNISKRNIFLQVYIDDYHTGATEVLWSTLPGQKKKFTNSSSASVTDKEPMGDFIIPLKNTSFTSMKIEVKCWGNTSSIFKGLGPKSPISNDTRSAYIISSATVDVCSIDWNTSNTVELESTVPRSQLEHGGEALPSIASIKFSILPPPIIEQSSDPVQTFIMIKSRLMNSIESRSDKISRLQFEALSVSYNHALEIWDDNSSVRQILLDELQNLYKIYSPNPRTMKKNSSSKLLKESVGDLMEKVSPRLKLFLQLYQTESDYMAILNALVTSIVTPLEAVAAGDTLSHVTEMYGKGSRNSQKISPASLKLRFDTLKSNTHSMKGSLEVIDQSCIHTYIHTQYIYILI